MEALAASILPWRVDVFILLVITFSQRGQTYDTINDATSKMGKAIAVWFKPGSSVLFTCNDTVSPTTEVTWWIGEEDLVLWSLENNWNVNFDKQPTNNSLKLTPNKDSQIYHALLSCKIKGITYKLIDLWREPIPSFDRDTTECPLIENHYTIITCQSLAIRKGGDWEWDFKEHDNIPETQPINSSGAFLIIGRDIPEKEGVYTCTYRWLSKGKTLKSFRLVKRQGAEPLEGHFCGHVQIPDAPTTQSMTRQPTMETTSLHLTTTSPDQTTQATSAPEIHLSTSETLANSERTVETFRADGLVQLENVQLYALYIAVPVGSFVLGLLLMGLGCMFYRQKTTNNRRPLDPEVQAKEAMVQPAA